MRSLILLALLAVPATGQEVVRLYDSAGRVSQLEIKPPSAGWIVLTYVTSDGTSTTIRLDADHPGPAPVPVPPSPRPTPPQPQPNPVPPAPQPASFGDLVRAEVLRINQPIATRMAVASGLARSYRAIGAQAAAGAFPSIDAMLSANRESVRAVAGGRPEWQPFFDWLKAQMEQRSRAGALPDLPSHAALWDEIATGLESVR